MCVFLAGRKEFKRIITRGVGLRGSISRPTNCPQHRPAFRPLLPLPVIDLTTWLFALGERAGARPWEMLKQVQHDVLLLAFAVASTLNYKP